MTRPAIVQHLFEHLERLSPCPEDDLRHPEYVLEMPQSSERIHGQANLQAFREAYPDLPSIRPRRLIGAGDVWVIEALRSDQSGRATHVVAVVEFREGKIWRDTRYFGDPFEAPAWRAPWVQPMDRP